MEKFIKENWFKSVIALGAIIITISASYYFVILGNKKEARIQEQVRIDLTERNKLETQIATKEALEKQKNENWNNFVNKCLTDAYAELKTLQGNFLMNTNYLCSRNSTICSQWREGNDKAIAEAFTTYKEEWVPQCNLGKRVFLHYEPMMVN